MATYPHSILNKHGRYNSCFVHQCSLENFYIWLGSVVSNEISIPHEPSLCLCSGVINLKSLHLVLSWVLLPVGDPVPTRMVFVSAKLKQIKLLLATKTGQIVKLYFQTFAHRPYIFRDKVDYWM